MTLTQSQLPSHTHGVMADTSQGNVVAPGPLVIPAKPVDSLAFPSLYVVPGTSTINPTAMGANSVASSGTVGSALPHDNMMPSLALNYQIALFGVFPSQN